MGITAKQIYTFYKDGFMHMRLGKTLWKIVALKLFIFFIIIKTLFFPNLLKERFKTDQERSIHILNTLTQGEH